MVQGRTVKMSEYCLHMIAKWCFQSMQLYKAIAIIMDKYDITLKKYVMDYQLLYNESE